MKEDKLKEILEELKDGTENSTVIYPTFDGSDEEEFENDKLLTPESCKLLFNHITKLQNNWNELKKMIQDSIIRINECAKEPNSEFNTVMKGTFGRVLNMMQELEGKSE